MFADFNTLLQRQQQYARDFRFLLRDVRTPEMTLTSLLSCYSFEMYSQRDDEVLTDDIHTWLILLATSPFIQHFVSLPRYMLKVSGYPRQRSTTCSGHRGKTYCARAASLFPPKLCAPALCANAIVLEN